MVQPNLDVSIRLIAETHELSPSEAYRLIRDVCGLSHGNRDRAVFDLAGSIVASKTQNLLNLLVPRNGHLSRQQTAFLDFLFTEALDDEVGIHHLVEALTRPKDDVDPTKSLTSILARALHRYRKRVLYETKHHNAFTAVRRFMFRHRPLDPLPRDGDTLAFWHAEATRDLLTRYSTALHALADYAEAARLAATWQEVRSLDEAYASGVAADAEAVYGPDDQLSDDKLKDALAHLENAPVKLLLAHERKALEVLAKHTDCVRTWPGDLLIFFSLGPFQNALIQVLRKGAAIRSCDEFLGAITEYDELMAELAGLDQLLMTSLRVIQKNIASVSETGSKLSNTNAIQKRKMLAMERRQSFTNLPIDERTEALRALIEPILALKSMIATYRSSWDKLASRHKAQLDGEHRDLFRHKLHALYVSLAGGGNP